MALQHQRLHLRHFALDLSALLFTVARDLSLLSLGCVRNLEPNLQCSATSVRSRVHFAIDGAIVFAYVEALSDEYNSTVICFLTCTVAWFTSQGIEFHRVM